MKVFKLNEGWEDRGLGAPTNIPISKTNNDSSWAASNYLVNRDVENPNIFKQFCKIHNLEDKVFFIFKHIKEELNILPSQLTENELLYFSKDGCKVIIHIENGLVTTIKKEKHFHETSKGFTKKTIDESTFSIEKLKYMLNEIS